MSIWGSEYLASDMLIVSYLEKNKKESVALAQTQYEYLLKNTRWTVTYIRNNSEV